MSHLSDETFIDLLDGTIAESDVPHLDTCSRCRAQLSELRQTMAVAADAEVPEPSPLFWDHMAARIRQGVEAEVHAPAPRGLLERLTPSRFSWWGVGGLVGVAAATLLVVSIQSPREAVTPGDTMVPVQATQVGEPELAETTASTDADESLGFVTDLASGIDWDAEANGNLASSMAIERSVATLNADERAELGRLLTDALRGGA